MWKTASNSLYNELHQPLGSYLIKIFKKMRCKTCNDMNVEWNKAYKVKISRGMLRNRLWSWISFSQDQGKSQNWQYGSNTQRYDATKNTCIVLLMTEVKWCLAVNQEFVMVQVMIKENSVGGCKIKGWMKTDKSFVSSYLI